MPDTETVVVVKLWDDDDMPDEQNVWIFKTLAAARHAVEALGAVPERAPSGIPGREWWRLPGTAWSFFVDGAYEFSTTIEPDWID